LPAVSCLFCERIGRGDDLLAENDLSVAFLDAFPLNPGHALIVPRRHEADLLALNPGEHAAIWELVAVLRLLHEERYVPDGYNVGANIGIWAGQTIDHAHLHLIPRYRGDVRDPRGGIRWVIPDRAAYWASGPDPDAGRGNAGG